MCQSFINECVTFLKEKYDNNISEVNVLLPSKRAQLFFNIELSKQFKNRAIWQPKYISIDNICENISGIKSANRIALLIELHKIYNRYIPETFDSFYHWGEVILADFDAIDNYNLDAKSIFVNISDLADIDALYGDVAQEQRDFILNFWKSFTEVKRKSNEQMTFLRIWNILYKVYSDFQEELSNKGIGYRGLIYRRTAEKMASGELFGYENQNFAIIGFNALSSCEKLIFKGLSSKTECDFFWDYDNFYIAPSTNHDAGTFIKENIKMFGQSGVVDKNNYIQKKDITFVDTPTDSLQCKYVWEFLNRCLEKAKSENRSLGRETAIVLTDESLLLPVLYSIPKEIEKFNITAGYPLSKSPIYNLLEHLISLFFSVEIDEVKGERYYINDIKNIISYPVISDSDNKIVDFNKWNSTRLNPNSSRATKKELESLNLPQYLLKSSENETIKDYLNRVIKEIGERYSLQEVTMPLTIEFLVAIQKGIRECSNLLKDVDTIDKTYISILRKHLKNSRLSFDGEPLVGVQIMGILETRGLDFENVLILSLNDDTYPGSSQRNSFIPNSLRKGFSLPTQKYQEAMYSYYFYRLIQRAKNIEFAYCNSSEGTKSGEASRFMLQIDYGKEHNVVKKSISIKVNLEEKDLNEPNQELYKEYIKNVIAGDRTISPNAICDWIRCRRNYYYSHVLKIRQKSERKESISHSDFGNSVHNILEMIYKKIINKPTIEAKEILKAEQQNIPAYVESWLMENFQDLSENSATKTISKFIISYINSVVVFDLNSSSDFMIKGIEQKISGEVVVNVSGVDKLVGLYGVVDRLESVKGIDMITDYKTGKQSNRSKTIETLFDPMAKDNRPYLQSLIYCYMYTQQTKRVCAPSLFFTKFMNSKDYQRMLILEEKSKDYAIENYGDVAEQFENELKRVVSEIVDNNTICLDKTENESKCANCDYKIMCSR